jgi:hypothetical protein
VTAAAPTFSQIKAQVAAIRQKSSSSYEAIGIRTQGRWTGEQQREDGGNLYLVYQCDSPLALRLALRESAAEGAVKVLITGLDEQSIDQDILLRLAKHTLFPINSWQIAKSLFGASSVDPRLLKHHWIADTLLDWMPANDYPTVSGGFLDAETVWPILLKQGIGLEVPRPDLDALLAWSVDPDNGARYQSTSPEFREAAAQWLCEMAGPVAQSVLDCAAASELPDAVPVGLLAEVIFHPEVGSQLDKAIGKLEERFLQGSFPNPALMKLWSDAASRVVQTPSIPQAQRIELVQRADQLLKELGAEAFAYLSVMSELGFAQRLGRFGARLRKLLASPETSDLELLTEAHTAIKQHEQASHPPHQRRIERVDMAFRLSVWLTESIRSQTEPLKDLGHAIQSYVQEGGFVDWARLSLRHGDPIGELSEAYRKLFDRVAEIQEGQSHQFAKLLQNWVEVGSYGKGFLPIENILAGIVAPLADQVPVLLVVIDGMSVAVCRELMANLQDSDWATITQVGQPSALMAGLAAIPSLTETSRTSLLCGQLTAGDQRTEQKGFSSHNALVKASRSKHPPLLFHKGALQDDDDSGLTGQVRGAIKEPQNKIVGVVVNAVDDYLSKGEQIDVRWAPQELKVLSVLLYEAKIAGRLVILVSDHGHILDCGMEHLAAGDSERWRSNGTPPTAKELQVKGQRVVIPESKALIAPWSEKLRYKPKKTGYHGGLNPQEMIVPIAVLSTPGDCPDGWVEAPVDEPLWWNTSMPELEDQLEAPQAQPEESQAHLGPLFSLIEAEVNPSGAESAPGTPKWIFELLDSASYQAQKKLTGRLAPEEALLTDVLARLDRHGYQMSLTALAKSLNLSSTQLQQVIQSLQRILNIDGYAVLTLDKAHSTVALNQKLLIQQFGL